jgi:hypothetical protein
MSDFLSPRRQRIAASLPLDNSLLVVGAGRPVPLPENSDQTYPFQSHADYFYLTELECPDGVVAYDPRDGEWLSFVPAVTAKLPTDNQDGDSLTNLQEFAFGTQPTVSTGEIAYSGGTITTPGAPKIVAAAGTYTMVFGRRADYVAAGLTYTVQFSADLVTWVDNDDVANVPAQVATDNTINVMSVTYPATIVTQSGTPNPKFSRVKVVLAP